MPPTGSPTSAPIRDERKRRAVVTRNLLLAAPVIAAASAALVWWAPHFSWIAVLVAAAAFLFPFLFLLTGAGIEGDSVYADSLPFRSLWDSRALGEIRVIDVGRAWIERSELSGIGVYTSVVIESKRGERATFGGTPDVAEDERASNDDPDLLAFHGKHMNRARGDFNKALDWLREHSLAVELATAERERALRIRWVRLAFVATAIVTTTTVGVSAWTFRQPSSTGIWTSVIVGLLIVALVAWASLAWAFRPGSRVSDVALYPEGLPLSCLWDSRALGAIRPEDIQSAKLSERMSTRASIGGPRLRVARRRGRDAVFFRSVAPTEFDLALKWLDDRGLPVQDGWHIRDKIKAGKP